MSIGRGIASMGKSSGGMRAVGSGIASMAKAVDASWWLSGGIDPATVAGVWQPKGAASLAASYLRLAGDEGYADIDPAVVGGVAPTWDAANGWIFNGTSSYLKSGITPTSKHTHALQLTPVYNSSYVYGMYTSTNSVLIRPGYLSSGVRKMQFINGDGSATITYTLEDGNIIMSGPKVYINGTPEITNLPAWSGTDANEIYFGGWFLSYLIRSAVTIKAIAIYKTVVTDAQALAVSTAMEAL